MNLYSINKISNLIIHLIGNKTLNQPIQLSESLVEINENIEELLIDCFFNKLNTLEYKKFKHNIDLSYNITFETIKSIFKNRRKFIENSKILATHLYDSTLYSNINSSEFYIIYLEDCVFEGEKVDAIGLFKTENKDIYLKIANNKNIFNIESDEGININSIETGCLIFNKSVENGYIISVLDKYKQNVDAKYWNDLFLNIDSFNNDFNSTKQTLSMCKNFITNIDKNDTAFLQTDKAELLNKSINYFKNTDTFNTNEFVNDVFESPSLIKDFISFKSEFESTNKIKIDESFSINSVAVKKSERTFKSILKLDKNFHIYIHGGKNNIEHGVEKDGRKFYKIYYQNES